MLLTELRLSERAVYLCAGAFAIPLVSSLAVFSSNVWSAGIWHLEALATTVVTVSLFGSMLWVLHRPDIKNERWALTVAGMLGSVGFLYTLVLLSRIARSVAVSGEIFTYVLWTAFTFICLFYVLKTGRSRTWVTSLSAAFLLPFLFSLQSLAAPAWSSSVLHPDAFGQYIVLAFGSLVAILFGVYSIQTGNGHYRRLGIVSAVMTIVYGFMVILLFWQALFPEAVATVLIYVSYALVLYAVLGYCWQSRTPFPWVYRITVAGVIPVAFSLSSMTLSWQETSWQIQAAGLFVMSALSVVTAVRYLMYQTDDAVVRTVMRRAVTVLLSLALFYMVVIVWKTTHVFSTSESIAATIALFVYTVAGLGLYVVGSSRGTMALKYAGMTLLALVVVRLGTVEVWMMDIIWRIVTFLGIGFLFMVAALLEKKQ